MFEFSLVKDLLKDLKTTKLNDVIDKAHYFFTVFLLLTFVSILGAKQIFGQPISCMTSAEVPETWAAYIDRYCFVTGTYIVHQDIENMPWDEMPKNDSRKIIASYYQWIPYLLAVQAFFFYVPHLIWEHFQNSGVDVDFQNIVDRCVNNRGKSGDEREKELEEVAQNLVKTVERRGKDGFGVGLGSLGLKAYLGSKLLNLANAFLQFVFLAFLVGDSDFLWGIKVLLNPWTESGLFPLKSYCTYKQDVLGGSQPHTVQCALTLNFLYEKVCLILYFWYGVLIVVTAANILLLLAHIMTAPGRRSAAKKYLKTIKGNETKVDYADFADNKLGDDGMLLLRLVESNAGSMIASEVAGKYYDAVRKERIDQFSSC